MVLGKLPVPGRPTIWITVGQGPTTLAVGAGGGCLDIFTLIYPFSPLSPSLWETARYRLKYCLKGPLIPTQPTNQHCHKGHRALSSHSPKKGYGSIYTYMCQWLGVNTWEFLCYKGNQGITETLNYSAFIIGWLVVFGLNGPLRQYFSLYRAVSQRGR